MNPNLSMHENNKLCLTYFLYLNPTISQTKQQKFTRFKLSFTKRNSKNKKIKNKG